MSTSPSQYWNLIRLESVKICAYYHSLSEFIYAAVFLCLEDSSSLSLALKIFLFPLQNQSFSLGAFYELILLRIECFQVSNSLHIIQLWFSVLDPIYCQRTLLWQWLKEALIYGQSIMSLGVISLLYSFSRVVAFCVLLVQWPIQNQVLGLHLWDGPLIQSEYGWLLPEHQYCSCTEISYRPITVVGCRFVVGFMITCLLWQHAEYLLVT